MDASNFTKVNETKYHLLTSDNTNFHANSHEIPVMSRDSKGIFSKICEFIPSTQENFNTVKSLDVSAQDITASVDKVAKLKSNETLYKVGSIVALAATVVIIAAAVAGITLLTMFAAPGMGAILPLLVISTTWATCLGVGGIPASFCLVYNAFTNVSEEQRKLSTLTKEANGNHDKLKDYFTINYQKLKSKINSSIDKKNGDLEQLITLHEDCEALKKKIRNDLETHEKALTELKNLHRFYNPAYKTQSK